MVTHSLAMLEKHLVFAGDSPPRNFTNGGVKKRSLRSEDPMSHRIIEKRRRDRMNNCLADLSRLIPPEYLKKGRGRIEKTEIIEMAIKHMGHLQNIIASTRFSENFNNSIPSPPVPAGYQRDTPSMTIEQVTIKHYRMGYLECMSEVMHFLVEVQGYFPGDSLCVQMINHLHKHCDRILKDNFLKKHLEDTSSDSSTGPINIDINESSAIGALNSKVSVCEDNQQSQVFEGRPFDEYCSLKKYPSFPSNAKKTLDSRYQIYSESDDRKESKIYYETAGNCQKQFHLLSNLRESNSESVLIKEENGSSQLREMLTTPTSTTHINGQSSRNSTEIKGNTSPSSNTSGYETSSGADANRSSFTNYTSKSLKPADSIEQSEFQDGDSHQIMYKFKNNIKQRFSQEKKENLECDTVQDHVLQKKQKQEDYQKYEDSLMKERLNLLDRTETDEENVFKFKTEGETKKRIRYGSESEIQDGDIANRLNFGQKMKRREESALQFQSSPKLGSFSPNSFASVYNSHLSCKFGRQAECPLMDTSFKSLSTPPSDPGPGIPIFALHAKGSFYIPLTLDHATLAPYLAILGITKSDDSTEEKPVLHPVTISVNFRSHFFS